MNNRRKFRKINKNENEIITYSVLQISTKIISVLNINNYQIYISLNNKPSKNNYPSIYFVPNNLVKKLGKFKQNISVKSSGLYLGFIKKGKFYLSLEGAEFLLNFDCFSKDQKLIVNKIGEKSILYGNRILKSMIVQIPADFKKDAFLLVFNLNNKLIALAKAQVNYLTYQNLNHNDLIALNLVDKGYYLRKKQ